MYEFHAWVGLSDSAFESDLDRVRPVVDQLAATIAERVQGWTTASFAVQQFNGQYFLVANGSVNRWRDEGRLLEDLLALIGAELTGSWGLIYDRDDEMPDPPGVNAFRARVMARGQLVEQPDPFLSPINPVIED
jgi:hypothetical protein